MIKILLFIFIMTLICVSNIEAIQVSLSWDTNDDASYYIVYWGKQSKEYEHSSKLIFSPICAYTVENLENAIYYFAVKAFNDCGNSSDFSEEVFNSMEIPIYPVDQCFLILNGIYL